MRCDATRVVVPESRLEVILPVIPFIDKRLADHLVLPLVEVS